MLLAGPSGELELPKPCPARLFANAGSGYYRVLYKGALLARLLGNGGEHLSPAERVATLADVASLARSGDVPMATALSLVPAFSNDPARQVVETTVRIAESPGDFLVPDDLRSRYRRFVSDTFGARAQTLGFRAKPGEDEETALLRASLVGFVANEGDDPALVAEGTRLAKEWLRDRGGVDSQMVPSVLKVAARQGDVALFQTVLAEAKRSADRRERGRLLTALGQFRDPSVVPVALRLTLSDDFDPRESMAVLWAAAGERGTRTEGWEFLKKNFDRLAARLPGDWPTEFPWLAAGFSDEAHLKDAETFFRDKAPKYPGGPRILAQALESIQLRAALKAAQGESVREFLMRYEDKPTIDVRPSAGQGTD
jgi:alanyl aminopeptidase